MELDSILYIAFLSLDTHGNMEWYILILNDKHLKKKLLLSIENNIRGRISSVLGERYGKSDEKEKLLYIDAINLYGWAMSESLPYNEIKFDRNVKLEDISNTPDDSDID